MTQLSEQLNQLIRRGEGSVFLITSPRIDELIRDGRLLQESSRVPMIDALRIAVKTADSLLRSVRHLKEKYAVAVDKAAFEALLISAVQIKPNVDLDLETLNGYDDLDQFAFAQSYDVAFALAKRSTARPSLTMEIFEDRLRTSPSPQLTRELLARLGPAEPQLIGPRGTLPTLPARFPEVLHTRQKVDLTVRVLNVREDENQAKVEIVRKHDDHSCTVLAQQLSKEITLRFDGQNPKSRDRADLTAAQYLQLNVRITAIADCATHPAFQRKAALTLREVLEPRAPIDQLHAAAEHVQLGFGFDEAGGDSEPETA
jgi:hypothetical protein